MRRSQRDSLVFMFLDSATNFLLSLMILPLCWTSITTIGSQDLQRPFALTERNNPFRPHILHSAICYPASHSSNNLPVIRVCHFLFLKNLGFFFDMNSTFICYRSSYISTNFESGIIADSISTVSGWQVK